MGTKLRLIGRIHKVCSADAYEVEAEIEYFIDKHEYYSRLENEWAVYVSDWNDHVFEASETRLLHVSGIVSIKFDTTSLNLSEISQLGSVENYRELIKLAHN